MKRSVFSLVSALCLTASLPAYSIFDVGARYGTRWYEADSEGEAYNGYTLDAHYDILPILAIGGSLSQFSIADRDDGGFSSVELTEVGIDAVVSVPLIPIITPFARLNLNLMSEIKGSGTLNNSSVKVASKGAALFDPVLSLGCGFSFFPLVSLTLEATHGTVMRNLEESKINGQNAIADNPHAKDAKAATLQSVMLGVKVSL